ncbi:MAG TPA: beta-ketoacyl synthase chain length factor [Burkholderiales bacterium]|nr:beta-ketoacyl synthase chain length factor [Burkholderiales bacterium]
MRIYVESVGVLAPGLPDWPAARAVLSGQPFVAAPLAPPSPAGLPAAERRRSSPTVRLALAAAEQALAGSGIRAADMAMVFASAEASGLITHQLCEVLSRGGKEAREVSPTQFHNSVHNAPSGYYSIAMAATRAASSVCRGPWSFAAGLLAAATQICADAEAMMYVCYDSPLPFPLSAHLPVLESTAIAMVFTAEATPRSMAGWALEITGEDRLAPWPDWMPAAWWANASARGFDALATLAAPGGNARLPLADELALNVTPC